MKRVPNSERKGDKTKLRSVVKRRSKMQDHYVFYKN